MPKLGAPDFEKENKSLHEAIETFVSLLKAFIAKVEGAKAENSTSTNELGPLKGNIIRGLETLKKSHVAASGIKLEGAEDEGSPTELEQFKAHMEQSGKLVTGLNESKISDIGTRTTMIANTKEEQAEIQDQEDAEDMPKLLAVGDFFKTLLDMTDGDEAETTEGDYEEDGDASDDVEEEDEDQDEISDEDEDQEKENLGEEEDGEE